MILVDSNIFIDFWKNPTEKQKEIFLHNETVICGVIKSELLRGANSPKEYQQLTEALNCFGYLTFTENDWGELAKLFIDLRKSGISIPFQDGIIAYLAIKNNCEIWTNDKHFKVIRSIKPVLKLYN